MFICTFIHYETLCHGNTRRTPPKAEIRYSFRGQIHEASSIKTCGRVRRENREETKKIIRRNGIGTGGNLHRSLTCIPTLEERMATKESITKPTIKKELK